MGKWKVTVRHGSRVGREKFDSLDEAIDEARRRVDEIRREDRLPPIEVSGPGLIRSAEGGIDVMGDGHAIAYTGAVRKETIDADSLDEAFERLRSALGD